MTEIEFSKIETLFGKVFQKLDIIEGDVGVLKSDVGVLKSDVGVLKSDVGVLKSDVSTMKGRLDSIETRLIRMEKWNDRAFDAIEETSASVRSYNISTQAMIYEAFDQVAEIQNILDGKKPILHKARYPRVPFGT